MRIINQKSLIQIREEKGLQQQPTSDIHQSVAQLNANLTAFLEFYFGKFPDQA